MIKKGTTQTKTIKQTNPIDVDCGEEDFDYEATHMEVFPDDISRNIDQFSDPNSFISPESLSRRSGTINQGDCFKKFLLGIMDYP